MKKKTFQFVTAIVDGLRTVAAGAVTYFTHRTAINVAIVIIGTAVIEACHS